MQKKLDLNDSFPSAILKERIPTTGAKSESERDLLHGILPFNFQYDSKKKMPQEQLKPTVR